VGGLVVSGAVVSLIVKICVQGLQVWNFLATWGAPGCPKVDKEEPSLLGLEIDRRAVQGGEDEVGHRSGAHVAHLAGQRAGLGGSGLGGRRLRSRSRGILRSLTAARSEDKQ